MRRAQHAGAAGGQGAAGQTGGAQGGRAEGGGRREEGGGRREGRRQEWRVLVAVRRVGEGGVLWQLPRARRVTLGSDLV